MIKFVAVADTHFHNWAEFAEHDNETGNTRLTEQLEAFGEAYQTAREESAPLIIAGDLFHKRQAVDTRVYNAVYEFMYKNSDVEVYMIPGNHDKVTNSLKSSSSIDTFDYIPNLTVYTEPTYESFEEDDFGITFIPYGDEVQDIKEYVQAEDLSKNKWNMLVAHLGVEGSLTGNSNHRLEGAFTIGDLRPDDYDVILLGHYHKGQNLGGNPNHMYVGALTQTNFGESENTPGHILVQLEHPDESDITVSKIENKSTRFKTIELGEEPEDMEQLIKTHYLRYNTNAEGAKALENTGVDLSNVRINATEQATVETRIDIESDTSPQAITEKYMEEFYPEAKEEALEVLEEALQSNM